MKLIQMKKNGIFKNILWKDLEWKSSGNVFFRNISYRSL